MQLTSLLVHSQGGAIYQNNCISNNIRATVFDKNKAQQGSTLFLNNSVPVSKPCNVLLLSTKDT